MKFNDAFDFDILLGRDILPKLNIGLTGVAFRIKEEHAHSDADLSEEVILRNLNIEIQDDTIPDKSPAGSHTQRAEFHSIIKEALNPQYIYLLKKVRLHIDSILLPIN